MPTTPEDLVLSDEDAVALAQRLLDDGRPFHAHEVLEGQWKASGDAAGRACWQGLAQLAVGLTHQRRGNTAGAEALVQRGRLRLRGAGQPNPPLPVDIPGAIAWAEAWLAGDRHQPLRLTSAVGGAP